MSPELIVGILQFGALGLLALTLYFGLQANARMIEVLADALARCQQKQNEIMDDLRRCRQKETD